MQSAFYNRHKKMTVVLTIILCWLGVGAISYSSLIRQSLRLDESQSLWQTSHSIGGTLRVVAEDVHVPLYHLILHFWQLYFGHGIVTVRLLSLLFFMITIPLVYLLARQILQRVWALFATVIFSFMPFMDWYSNEARMYTLLAMMATLSQLYFILIIQKKRVWFGYGLVALIGAYTHYFFSFNLATQGIYYLYNRKRFAEGTFKRFFILGILVIAALAPWLIYFHSLGSAKNTSPQLTHPSTVDFFNVFSQFLFGFQNDRINTFILSCWPLVVLLAFFAIRRGQRISLEIGYIATAAIVPVIIAFLLSFIINPFFLSRYMISCVAPLIILIVWLISQYRRKLAVASCVLIVVGLILSAIQQNMSNSTPVKMDYHSVAQTVSKEAGPSDIVVLSAPFTVYPFEYYYNGSAQIDTLPIWNRQAAGAIPAFNKATMPGEVKQINANHRDLYLILSQNQGYEETIKQYFLHHYLKLSQHTYSPDLTLYVFKVGYDSVPPLGTAKTQIKSSSEANTNSPLAGSINPTLKAL